MKKILITNDDGFESEGLLALAEALKPLGEVTIVAPTIEKSACGHSLTLTKPLHFVQLEEHFYKLDDGTPSDCIFLSLTKLFPKENRPDIVISGINIGSNMGEDITYSGTASAAMEAVLQGIPAIAISQVYKESGKSIDKFGYGLAQKSIAALVQKIFEGDFPLPPRKFLNINVPPVPTSDCKGFKVTRAGNRLYAHDAEVHINPRGKEYYWIGLPALGWMETKGHVTDFEAINDGYVSITPVHLDMTSYDDIHTLEKWI
ncbi:MAG: stationary phase survival protein SurE [Epsilonproteobacteria bacterium (ex Lamellibrachia satsuma)]|nr:MAG: stationary phase survival protein SurE [Epsilonproteobacteria bacterium (ex Lamellibrachia satsuma)]